MSTTLLQTTPRRLVGPRPLVVLAALLAVLAAGLVAAASPGRSSVTTPVIGISAPEAVMAGTSTTSATTQAYKIAAYVAGKPVRWNPCATIHWRFRTAYAPSGGFKVVAAAVAQVSRATGIHFVYDGTSTAVPTTRWLPSTTALIHPLLIGWTDGSHSDLLRGMPSAVLGVTRTAYFAASVNGVTLAATKSAVVALDRTNRLPLTGPVSWSSVIQHELGHAMGLDHVRNSRELMYPMLQRTVTGLQRGDDLGLYRLGVHAGCIRLPF